MGITPRYVVTCAELWSALVAAMGAGKYLLPKSL